MSNRIGTKDFWAEQRPNGRWYGFVKPQAAPRVSAHGPDGEKSSLDGGEVLSWAADAYTKLRAGTFVDPRAGKLTFADYYERWRDARIMELNTISTYDSHFRKEFKPFFGDMAIASITHDDVQSWITDMHRRTGSQAITPSTIHAKVKHLSTIMGAKKGTSAINSKVIKTNPCENVQLPPVDYREPQVYDVEESDKVLDAVSSWWQPIPLLAVDTGMRWGELMGLTVSDFSDDFSEVLCTRTVVENTAVYTGNGTPFAWKPKPKSGKPRRAFLSEQGTAMVEHLVKSRGLFGRDRLFSMPAGKLRYVHDYEVMPGSEPRREDPWLEGWPVSRNFFRDRVWLPAHASSGIAPLRFHDLRASALTWAKAGGADIDQLRDMAGHSDIKITDVYLGKLKASGNKGAAEASHRYREEQRRAARGEESA